MSSTIRSLVVRVGADLSRFNKSMNKMYRTMSKAGRKFTAVGSTLTRGLTLPLLAVGAAAFKMGKDFEAATAKIVGLVGVAREQVNAWSKDMLEMAPDLATAPNELAEGLFFVTSAGQRGAEAMMTLELSAKAAAAGLGSVKTVADVVTSAMNAYADSELDAATATDILTAGVREGKLEAESLAPVIGNLLPVASAMGIEFDQVVGTLAAMSRTGSEAASSATSLQQIMMTLLKPTNEASNKLKEAGLSMSMLRDMAAGPNGLLDVMRLLDKTFADDEEALGEIIPNVRAFRGAMNLLAQDSATVDSIMNNVTNSAGILSKAFLETTETTGFKFDQAIVAAKVSLDTLWGTIKDDIIPIIDKAAEWFGKITDKLNAMTDAQKDSMLKWAKFALIIGPVLLLFGKLLTIIPMLGTAFAALMGPVGLVALAFAGIAIGVIAWQKKYNDAVADIEANAKKSIALVEEERDARIIAYREALDEKRAALDEESRLVEENYDEAISELEDYQRQSLSTERTRLQALISANDRAYDNIIQNIREEYGVFESSTKSKMDIADTYYDDLVDKAGTSYQTIRDEINKTLKADIATVDAETQTEVDKVQTKIDLLNTETEEEKKAAKETANATRISELEKESAFGRSHQIRKNAAAELVSFLEAIEQEKNETIRNDQIAAYEQEITDLKDAGVTKAEELTAQAATDKETAGTNLATKIVNINKEKDAAIQAIDDERKELEKAELLKHGSRKKFHLKNLWLLDNGFSEFVGNLETELTELKRIEEEKYNTRKEWLDKSEVALTTYEEVQAGINEENRRDAEQAILEIQQQAVVEKEAIDIPTPGVKGAVIDFANDEINSIDWFKPFRELGEILGFEKGGTVPGAIGEPMLAVVHGGEEITPAGGNGGAIEINATYYVADKATAEYANNDLVRRFQQRGIGGSFL